MERYHSGNFGTYGCPEWERDVDTPRGNDFPPEKGVRDERESNKGDGVTINPVIWSRINERRGGLMESSSGKNTLRISTGRAPEY